jgi:hypothetical protein
VDYGRKELRDYFDKKMPPAGGESPQIFAAAEAAATSNNLVTHFFLNFTCFEVSKFHQHRSSASRQEPAGR